MEPLLLEANNFMISSNVIVVEKDAILDALPVLPDTGGAIPDPTAVVIRPAAASGVVETGALPDQREAGDQVNGFLLCALVSDSAKRLKTRAHRAGISLPMTVVTRFVLRAYRLSATDDFGPFATAALDIPMLRRMDAKILEDIIAYQSVEKSKNDLAKRARSAHRESGPY
jgi:hypothetical protein